MTNEQIEIVLTFIKSEYFWPLNMHVAIIVFNVSVVPNDFFAVS